MQLFKIPESDGLRGASLGTSRNQPRFLPVIAEGALKSAAVFRTLINHSERTRDHTVSTAVTHIRLDKHRSHFGAYDRAGGTRFQTSSIGAMFTDIGKKNPTERVFCIGHLRTGNFGLFQKHKLPPGGSTQGFSVVVREPAQHQPVFRDFVPFLARHFASLTPDA